MNLTGVRLWIRAYPLTERNAVGNRIWKHVLVLSKGVAQAWHIVEGWQPCKGNCMVPIQSDSKATAPSKGKPMSQ